MLQKLTKKQKVQKFQEFVQYAPVEMKRKVLDALDAIKTDSEP